MSVNPWRSFQRRFGQSLHLYLRAPIIFDSSLAFLCLLLRQCLGRSLAVDNTSPPIIGTVKVRSTLLACTPRRLIAYSGNQFELNFLRTYDDKEIDLVVQRPGKPLLLIEIKSSNAIQPDHVASLIDLRQLIDAPAECALFSRDPVAQVIRGIRCLP